MSDKYSNGDLMTAFAFLANALSGGSDAGQAFPYSDAEDLSRGLRFIPGEVTEAQRRGEPVRFADQHCSHPCCWYWQFSDGSRTYYWDRGDYEQIANANGKRPDELGRYPDGVGPCPDCGNEHTRGGHIEREGTV